MKHSYNGMGYDLAGKVMEVVTGKSIFRLFQEYLYDPLEMNNTIHDLDLGFSCNSTAFDLAKVAQLILNKGTYGDKQFFSEETYEKLIPTDLSEFYPGVDMIWGIGLNIKSNKVRDKKTGEDHSLLSKDIIGHGSATSTIFWVDLEHNIVVTQSRRGGKRHFIENLTKVTEVIEKYLTN
jgi:CubicO group peptidase (beta-lactamase class C family)